jgi:hypothetical protein
MQILRKWAERNSDILMIINDKMVVGVLKQILTAIFFKYLVNPFIPPYLFGIFPLWL